MAAALRQAEFGLASTSPNPRVGCIIARDGQVVGQGWHERAGEAHAEVHALQAAGALARGATAYVTLEPCAHHGRTPPCTEALINAGVSRVVAAMQDPNPAVSGRGLAHLADAGISTACGLLADEAEELNCGFVSRMRRGRPWLRLKSAASLDGRTALANGISQWISSEASRADAHHWRARSCAILTGIGTVLNDDPQLTARAVGCERQPIKVVVDSELRTPPNARLLASGRVLVACARMPAERADALQARGAEILHLPGADGRVDLWAVLRTLANQGVNEVLGEAGPTLGGALIASGCADELLLYLAPKILGNGARALFDMPDITSLGQADDWQVHDCRQIAGDIRLRLRPRIAG
ncbi:MAG: bifunctional diaminohydroxyphosphoribosylaminopyrimidine deaminase/5-amino-6-(5-phosphoribosylamino)uracil reductase RibD [Rhodocyclaceae bacterium]|nr:bifunctional diaminohydroxyphosphoribosylaminopyrimidine deaminase/5-amino-6-(5-phosphoribosylamino)uracil reductase RibD [Rhodocyclaceae bacterium]